VTISSLASQSLDRLALSSCSPARSRISFLAQKKLVHVSQVHRTYRYMSLEIEAIQRAAAEFIRDRHRLGAFVNGLLRDAHAAEDVLQEVWIRLSAELGNGTVLESQAAWCRGVARNLIRKHWEKQRTAKVLADSAVMEAFADRVEQAFSEDDLTETWAIRQQALDACVAKLPARSTRMLSLRYVSGDSLHEVGLAVGMSLEGVTKALYRIRQSLLECVERKLSGANS
jgi:RNA polymerase sigma-70 factor (ECF subfamily)